VGAALLADAGEVDVVEAVTITTATCNNNTTSRVTTTTTTCPPVNHSMDASMETAALVATMGVVAAMAVALVSYAALPGTKQSYALRRVKKTSVPSP